MHIDSRAYFFPCNPERPWKIDSPNVPPSISFFKLFETLNFEVVWTYFTACRWVLANLSLVTQYAAWPGAQSVMRTNQPHECLRRANATRDATDEEQNLMWEVNTFLE